MKETSKTIVTVLEKPRENKPTKKEEKTMVNRDVLVISTEKSIVKDSSIIKEKEKVSKNKYIKREMPMYFNIKKVDAAVIEQFLLLIKREVPINKKKTSLGALYGEMTDYLISEINDKDLLPLIKRMYTFMIRYILFNRFTYIISSLLCFRLPITLWNKLFDKLHKSQLNIENLYRKESGFPTQEQTLARIDTIAREIILEINQYNTDISNHILLLPYAGLKNMRAQIYNKITEEFKQKNIYSDVDFIYYIIAGFKEKKLLTKNFDEKQLHQLSTYIDDLYSQLSLIFIPYKAILSSVAITYYTAEQRALLEDAIESGLSCYHLNNFSYLNIIQIDPYTLVQGAMVSSTQYKNILLSLENLIRDISIMACKNYAKDLLPLYEQVMIIPKE
jgi:hypothetical protein